MGGKGTALRGVVAKGKKKAVKKQPDLVSIAKSRLEAAHTAVDAAGSESTPVIFYAHVGRTHGRMMRVDPRQQEKIDGFRFAAVYGAITQGVLLTVKNKEVIFKGYEKLRVTFKRNIHLCAKLVPRVSDVDYQHLSVPDADDEKEEAAAEASALAVQKISEAEWMDKATACSGSARELLGFFQSSQCNMMPIMMRISAAQSMNGIMLSMLSCLQQDHHGVDFLNSLGTAISPIAHLVDAVYSIGVACGATRILNTSSTLLVQTRAFGGEHLSPNKICRWAAGLEILCKGVGERCGAGRGSKGWIHGQNLSRFMTCSSTASKYCTAQCQIIFGEWFR